METSELSEDSESRDYFPVGSPGGILSGSASAFHHLSRRSPYPILSMYGPLISFLPDYFLPYYLLPYYSLPIPIPRRPEWTRTCTTCSKFLMTVSTH
jgi:hypothetical protein